MIISSICWRAVILICFLLIELVISIIIFEDIFNSNKPWVRTLGWILATVIIVAVIGWVYWNLSGYVC